MTQARQPVREALPVLSFERTVARRYVHRQAIAEVFLTDCAELGEPNRFALAAQWPRLHGFYRAKHGRFDPMLLAETLRQAAIYLAHTRYRVPPSWRFVMQEMHVRAHLDALRVGMSAADVTAETTLSDLVHRGEVVTSFRIELRYWFAGREIGSASGVAVALPPSAYSRARWGTAGPRTPGPARCSTAIAPAVVGQVDERDVVLGRPTGRGEWEVRVDVTHPVLFDHPLDHLPGMLLLEVLRQGAFAALQVPDAHLASIDAVFHRFAELDQHTTVGVRALDADPLSVRAVIRQAGSEIATGHVRLAHR
ncbi:ScbA/BarX family gamma-butyrolactone biosynthesis protein [Rhodococcus sp. T2V]|uniref:ScbA/BarX family gamma-butyrolactone biosynthesis protein n=1 Tax=Rhodococcus sp. T2V TaxID=3034164 RepID=UPI0023E2CFA1|nr:ScbA/BarX family gamma-butyrolactone biosynthesis protein [Rhodococcus sp. T2V]MDF3311169.1 ScbA/BarX family gamma-butyrolactone biosynthesis protein [Rhodococcus sp. T2V]